MMLQNEQMVVTGRVLGTIYLLPEGTNNQYKSGEGTYI